MGKTIICSIYFLPETLGLFPKKKKHYHKGKYSGKRGALLKERIINEILSKNVTCNP